MEVYPREYVGHNLPLIFVSGIASAALHDQEPKSKQKESGTKLVRSSPECDSDRADAFFKHLSEWDGNDRSWNASALPGPSGRMNYKIEPVGKVTYLPPRKAAPVAMPASAEPPPSTQGTSAALHSPLSPLSPGSPLFPDGILTPLWFHKHQEQVPSLFISCFDLFVDGVEVDIHHIQADINDVRNTLSRSGYRTRFVAVLFSDRSILEAPRLEESLAAIRKGTSLDAKTSLFFMPPIATLSEMSAFVQTVLTIIQPLVVEHYRELAKHSRRKRARAANGSGASSPAGAGSQALSASGWNVRYDIKQGIFAEFRQEMDIAGRHYVSAMEELFKEDGILETTPSWAPRWNQTRLLCDALALRIIRSQLWTNVTSGAAESWINYRDRVRSLVDRRGKGCETYAWSAWEARWASIMSELVQRAQPTELCTSIETAPNMHWYPSWAKPEKIIDRLPPLQNLHHAGYWSLIALGKLRERRKRAMLIPEADKVPPSQISASEAASRTRNYDLYLAPPPHEEIPLPGNAGYDYLEGIAAVSSRVIQAMRARGQLRLADEIQFRLGKDYMQSGRTSDAFGVLKPLWQEGRWGKAGWDELQLLLIDFVYQCALSGNDAETVIATSWQRIAMSTNNVEQIDILDCLKSLQLESQTLEVTVDADKTKGPIEISLAFTDAETHVGESIECQLIMKSHAVAASAPLTFARIDLQLSGDQTITILHELGEITQDDGKAQTTIHDLSEKPRQENDSTFWTSNLRLAPEQVRVFRFNLQFREPGTIFAERAALRLEAPKFTLVQNFTTDYITNDANLYVQHGSDIMGKSFKRKETARLLVLPRPPKLEINLPEMKTKLFTNENALLAVEISNGEAENISGRVLATLEGPLGDTIELEWEAQSNNEPNLAGFDLEIGSLCSFMLRVPSPSETGEYQIRIQANYQLISDPQTNLVKSEERDIEVGELFLAKFDLGPQYHDATWPSFFSSPSEEAAETSEGIVQSWRLGTQITSTAVDRIVVGSMALMLDTMPSDAICTTASPEDKGEYAFTGSETKDLDFAFTTQKISLDDRRPSTIEMSIIVDWWRHDEEIVSKAIIAVPRLTLPSSEPRVLLAAERGGLNDVDVVLHYYLENPSLHFLTFALTMESSDDFAFSGPKYQNLSLAPLSRHEVRYSVLVHEKGDSEREETRQIRPSLQVVDSYYQKTLKTHPGGPNVSFDEQGIVVKIRPRSETAIPIAVEVAVA